MKKFIIIPILIMIPVLLIAQKKQRKLTQHENMILYNEYIDITKSLQSETFSIDMHIKNETNHVFKTDDTASYSIRLNIREGSSYYKLGNMEQIITDSMSLLVSVDQKLMIVFKDTFLVKQQSVNLKSFIQTDTAVASAAMLYNASKNRTSPSKSIFEFEKKEILPGTNLTVQKIIFEYNSLTKKPEKLTTVQRRLIPLSESQFEEMGLKPGLSEYLIRKGDMYYFIKEQTTSINYNFLNQSPDKYAVSINERIVKTAEGEYIPAKGFESFKILIN